MVSNPDASAAGVSWRLRLAVVLAAIGFVWLSLSPGFVSGSGAFWQFPQGDAARCEIGWMYYAHDQWRLPLFAIGNYHDPEGSNVYLSDSLPLIALPAKIVYKLTGWLPTYTGFWVALCFFLQAIFASRLLRALGVRDWLPHFAGIVLFCYVPFLFARFGHMTLMGHFFILAELEGYVRAKREGLSRGGWAWICALPVVAILVQPYLAAMALMLALVTILDQWRGGRLALRGVALRIGAIALASAAVVLIGGFVFPDTHPHDDYGLYSFNLMSPFVPFADTRLGQWLGTATPSIEGIWQWEGGVYLGAGVLLALLACLPFWRGALPVLKRHAVLVSALALALVFAISNRVGLGPHELLHVPLPDFVRSAFSALRGSGRFAWPAMYALIAMAIACVASRYRRTTAAAVLVAAAVLQWVDAQPTQSVRRAASAAGAQPAIHQQAWQGLIATHERIFQFPSFECGGIYDEEIGVDKYQEMQIDLIAARANKPTNSNYPARYTKNCKREREAAALSVREPGTLYLYRSSADIGAFITRYGQDTSRCGTLDEVVVCSAMADLSSLH